MNESLYRYYSRSPSFTPAFLLTPSKMEEITPLDTLYQTYLKEPAMSTVQQTVQNLIKTAKLPSQELFDYAAANAVELDDLRAALKHINETLDDAGIDKCPEHTPTSYRMQNRMGLLRTRLLQDYPANINRLINEADKIRSENTHLKTANNTLFTASTQQGEKIAELIKERNALKTANSELSEVNSALRNTNTTRLNEITTLNEMIDNLRARETAANRIIADLAKERDAYKKASEAPSHVTPDHANLLDKCHALLKHWKTKETCNLLRELDKAAQRSEGALRTEPLSDDNCSTAKVAEAMQATSIPAKEACENMAAGSKTVSARKYDAPKAFSELNEPMTYHVTKKSNGESTVGKIVAHSITRRTTAEAICAVLNAAEHEVARNYYLVGSNLDL